MKIDAGDVLVSPEGSHTTHDKAVRYKSPLDLAAESGWGGRIWWWLMASTVRALGACTDYELSPVLLLPSPIVQHRESHFHLNQLGNEPLVSPVHGWVLDLCFQRSTIVSRPTSLFFVSVCACWHVPFVRYNHAMTRLNDRHSSKQ